MRSEVLLLFVALSPLSLSSEIRRDIEYSRPSGVSLALDAAIAGRATDRTAAVILIHGGGWSQGDKSRGIEPLASALSAAGIAWFSIDYRLAPQHIHPAAIEDIEAAIDFVVANAAGFRVDRKRLFLAGFSAGGHLTALTAITTAAGSKLAGVLSFYGRMDLTRGFEVPGLAVEAIRSLLGLKPQAPVDYSLLHAASPITRVHPDLPPFVIVHGTADNVVPFDDSQRMCSTLREAGIACDLIPIAGGGHGMSSWRDLDPNTDFVPKVLQWIDAVPTASSVRP